MGFGFVTIIIRPASFFCDSDVDAGESAAEEEEKLKERTGRSGRQRARGARAREDGIELRLITVNAVFVLGRRALGAF
eukprot:185568-Rhodomonas_salina.1